MLDLSEDSAQVAPPARTSPPATAAEIVLLHVVEFVPVEPMGETLMPTLEMRRIVAARARAPRRR